MKNYKIIICIISAIVLVSAIVIRYDDLKKEVIGEKETDALKFKNEYEILNGEEVYNGMKYPSIEISEDNPIKYSDATDIEKVMSSGNGIIYLGYPKCPWCRNAVPVLLHAAIDAGVGTIYYVDMTDERDSYIVDENNNLVLEKEGTDNYKKLLEILDEYLDDYYVKDKDGNEINTGEKRIYVPVVFFVRNGKVVGIHIDTVESQKNPFQLLNDEQYEELYNIYTNYIHEMLGDMCTERC